MATTMYIPQLKNTAAEASVEGTVAKNGIRFRPAADGHQPVLNINLKFQRRWTDKTTNEWTGKQSFVGYALWGDQATALNNKLAALDPSLKDIRIKVTFSMADLETRIWGAQMDKTETNIRASAMELTGAYPFAHGEGAAEDPASEPAGDDIPL